MATTTIWNAAGILVSVIKDLSEENYEQSFAKCRFSFELAKTYSQVPSDFIFDAIWKQITNHQIPSHDYTYPTSPLILPFANDAESDSILGSHSAGLLSRLYTSILAQFFNEWLGILHLGHTPRGQQYQLGANFIAHGVNLGYVAETAIRKHILQLLIGGTSGPGQNFHRVTVLCTLLKIEGATFAAYTDSSVVDRCLEFLKDYDCGNNEHLKRITVSGLSEELAWS